MNIKNKKKCIKKNDYLKYLTDANILKIKFRFCLGRNKYTYFD